MVQKSYGKMHRSRSKMKLRKKTTLTRHLATFKIGDKVHVDFVSARMPHPKWQGHTGSVLEIRGNSYVVEIRDGNAIKKLSLRPEHLFILINNLNDLLYFFFLQVCSFF